MNNPKARYIFLAILALVAVFAIFPRLGSLPLREWDESRVAASASEMYLSGNPLVVTFDAQPDLWNTKPPLLIWLQAASIGVFGMSEMAVRLPSAIAMFVTSLALFWFCAKLNRPLAGFYSSLVFLCSKGLLFYHCGRSADYDSLMIMFCVLYCGFFYLYCKSKKTKYWIGFALCLSLGVLTKSVQAILPLAPLLIYIICKGEFVPMLRKPATYLGVGLFVLLVGGFYVAREALSQGYLLAVWNNELGGRYLTVLEEHSGGFWFYWDFLKNTQFDYFFWLVPVCFVLNFCFKSKEARQANLFCGLLAVGQFLVISTAQTKLEWYSLPIIPSLAVIIGICMAQIQKAVCEKYYAVLEKRKAVLAERNSLLFWRKYLPVLLCFTLAGIFFYFPYSEILNHNFVSAETEDNKPYYSRVNLMKLASEGKTQTDYNTITYIEDERAQLDYFYRYVLNENGIQTKRKTFAELQVGDTVQVNNPATWQKVNENYNVQELDFLIQSRIVRLSEKKQKDDGNISSNTEL